MKPKIGDTVEVIGTGSIPESFLGKKGKVTDIISGKVVVEFIPRVGMTGSISHTALPFDLKLISEG